MAKFRIGDKPSPPPKPKPVPFSDKDRNRPKPIFEQLHPFQWRDLILPTSRVEVRLAQDLVEHKVWDVDGAFVEATGMAPLSIEVEIPFINNIVPGKAEKFVDILYPGVFRRFLEAFKDRTTGELIHPELGSLRCKPHSMSFTHDAERRDGVIVHATWVETRDINPELTKTAPTLTATLAAISLDASERDLRALAPELPVFEDSLESLMGKATGILDSVTTTIQQIANIPNKIIYRINKFEGAIDRLQRAQLWAVKDSVAKVKEKAYELRDRVENPIGSPTRRRVKSFFTPRRMSMSDILATYPSNSSDDLLALNKGAFNGPTVPKNTRIFYYDG